MPVRHEVQRSRVMTRWSSSSRPTTDAALRMRSVKAWSSGEGVALPDGWLCARKKRLAWTRSTGARTHPGVARHVLAEPRAMAAMVMGRRSESTAATQSSSCCMKARLDNARATSDGARRWAGAAGATSMLASIRLAEILATSSVVRPDAASSSGEASRASPTPPKCRASSAARSSEPRSAARAGCANGFMSAPGRCWRGVINQESCRAPWRLNALE